MTERLVILDRDGVINHDSDAYIKSVEEWRPIPGSLEAMARLHHAGWRLAIATNQSGIARGLFDPSTLDAIHQRLREQLADHGARVEMIAFCPHGPDAGCRCRKPLPGLLEQIARRLGADLRGVPVIGDSLRDLEAARSAGAAPWLVRTGKGERTLAACADHPGPDPLADVPIFPDLSAAADALLASDTRP
ncbi:D-glycero-beta-D-manno-heptose 1,7-bisphosphate 7-phosphatase [Marichromatium bheemlicum]|uniref:D,D-heptose 1,7-bisphosphate phosphatase n=1 Tax=Marichromatium bheemlicum TaxID=365339 RepID=A0ABX1I4Z6_9GAMM|nr:D-glycero-beta-D-manno-heptose 1,7-bisphosphate 7-phosphatase [Marichromatium bheemlicum]NKN32634.1 D-glycero-beta-D-manno-heptose 1,7-bisphosphate 7-phosphatase [Marichromatium bheemlicum]